MDWILSHLWQTLVLLGILSCGLEILIPGILFLPIGLGALISAPLALFLPEWAVVTSWAIGSWGAWKMLDRWFYKNSVSRYPSNIDGMIGQKATVIDPIDPIKGTGSVKLYGDIWGVIPEKDRIETEEIVEIVDIEGNRVRVRPISETSAEVLLERQFDSLTPPSSSKMPLE